MNWTESKHIIDQIINSLRYYNLDDIKRARKSDCNIGAFILCGCFIDHLSNYRYFEQGNDAFRFKNFANDYMSPVYYGRGVELYSRFRNSLVHNYSIKGMYILEWGNRSLHLITDPKTQSIFLDLDEFIEEMEKCFEKYVEHLLKDQAVQELALKHFKEYPIMQQL